jgi:hypothetical protein
MKRIRHRVADARRKCFGLPRPTPPRFRARIPVTSCTKATIAVLNPSRATPFVYPASPDYPHFSVVDRATSASTACLAGLAPHIRMCDSSHMATNLAIDDRLLEEARRIGGQKTKRATVTEALNEYIQRRKQQQIVELFGKLDVDPTYDYKKQRRRK